MEITVSLNEEEEKLLKKRAKKNLLTLREQVEDIVRRSCITYKEGTTSSVNVDDKLVAIFSREKRGRKK